MLFQDPGILLSSVIYKLQSCCMISWYYSRQQAPPAQVFIIQELRSYCLHLTLFLGKILLCNMNNYLYWHIMLFQDLGTLLFKPLAALGGLKNKLPQVLKQHNVPIEVIIHTLITPDHFKFYCHNLMNTKYRAKKYIRN